MCKEGLISFNRVIYQLAMTLPRLVADCDKEGPEHCETVYNTVCETKWKVHEVVDDVTNCETVIETGDCKTVYLGRTMHCGPRGCSRRYQLYEHLFCMFWASN